METIYGQHCFCKSRFSFQVEIKKKLPVKLTVQRTLSPLYATPDQMIIPLNKLPYFALFQDIPMETGETLAKSKDKKTSEKTLEVNH